MNRLLDELRGIERNFGDEPLRELALQLAHFFANFARHIERVRTGGLIDRQSRRRPTIKREHLRVGLRAELDLAYIAEPRDLAGTAGLDDHLRELGRIAQSAENVKGILERLTGRRGRRANLTRRDLRALLLQRLNYVLRH